LRAVPLIVKKIPDFRFLVIEKHVEFTGRIKDSHTINNMIAKSALAAALYQKGDIKRNFSYYTDPGKLKVYLGLGIPVLLTDVPHNAKEIEMRRCGKVIDLDTGTIAKAAIDLMKDEKTLEYYRKNAADYGKEYDWNSIFGEVLKC